MSADYTGPRTKHVILVFLVLVLAIIAVVRCSCASQANGEPKPPSPPTQILRVVEIPPPRARPPPASPKRQPKLQKPRAPPVRPVVAAGGGAVSTGDGPIVSIALPRDGAHLVAFARRHGARFTVSRAVSGDRAEILANLEWSGDRLTPARSAPFVPMGVPRLLVDPAQLAALGRPLDEVKETMRVEGRLMLQIFLDAAEVDRAVATVLGAERGRRVSCRGLPTGAIACSTN